MSETWNYWEERTTNTEKWLRNVEDKVLLKWKERKWEISPLFIRGKDKNFTLEKETIGQGTLNEGRKSKWEGV